jgi:hypothetical protein
MFEPTSKVSGLSVLSRKVTQGTPRMQVSSCTRLSRSRRVLLCFRDQETLNNPEHV